MENKRKEMEAIGKYPSFIARKNNKKLKVLLIDNIFEISFKTVDGSNEPRSLNIPLKGIGNELRFKLSEAGAIDLFNTLGKALNYHFNEKDKVGSQQK